MENYKFIEKIGRGTHGTVYLLQDSSHPARNSYVVCKSIVNKFKSHAYREIAILSKLSHKRIIKLIDTVILKDSIFLILEYINYGSLESMMLFFAKNSINNHPILGWSVLSQISDALHYIHSKKIIHRDIKPSNILIHRFYVKSKEFLVFKLCDFSLSSADDAIDYKHTVGTPFYMAPEMVKISNGNRIALGGSLRRRSKEDSEAVYDASIDCWGLGCCVYELLTLRKPFTGINRDELFNSILSKEITESITEDMQLDQIIKQCLKKANRISSKMIMKNEKVKLNLAMLELKFKENRIEELEHKIEEFQSNFNGQLIK